MSTEAKTAWKPSKINPRTGRPVNGMVYTLSAAPVRLFADLIMRRRWLGGEYLPERGGFIAVSNHVTELDAVTFMHYLMGHHYAVRMLIKSSLMKIPVVGACAKYSRMIPVYRASDHAGDSLRDAKGALNCGECVGIFPEGTLTRDPNLWPMKGHTGAARLALSTGVPVIPVVQWGAAAIKEPYGKWHLFPPFPRKIVTVQAGSPVNLDDLYGREDSAAVTEATRRIMAALTQQLAQLRPGETPPEAPYDMKTQGDRYHRNKGSQNPRTLPES